VYKIRTTAWFSISLADGATCRPKLKSYMSTDDLTVVPVKLTAVFCVVINYLKYIVDELGKAAGRARYRRRSCDMYFIRGGRGRHLLSRGCLCDGVGFLQIQAFFYNYASLLVRSQFTFVYLPVTVAER
jgi:hypothetical protein